MKTHHWSYRTLAALISALALALTACGKKEEEVAATEAPAQTTEEAAPAEETASAQEESTTDDLVISQIDVQETLNASDKAAQAKDWQAATDNLLKIQLSGSMKNDSESWQYNRRMTVLQDQLIQAADAGDPKAKAAIELLRKSRRVR
ncbi:MAG: hypothetical protein JNK85_27730 [Verrucomicrobiales bacterium]|nr:hypothetical protein [Verrucomicrobiales bacterium]